MRRMSFFLADRQWMPSTSSSFAAGRLIEAVRWEIDDLLLHSSLLHGNAWYMFTDLSIHLCGLEFGAPLNDFLRAVANSYGWPNQKTLLVPYAPHVLVSTQCLLTSPHCPSCGLAWNIKGGVQRPANQSYIYTYLLRTPIYLHIYTYIYLYRCMYKCTLYNVYIYVYIYICITV